MWPLQSRKCQKPLRLTRPQNHLRRQVVHQRRLCHRRRLMPEAPASDMTPEPPATASGPPAPPVPPALPASTTDVAPGVLVSEKSALPWAEPALLNNPSSAPLHTFYVYRAVSGESYPPLNTNLANLAGALWYLHHEVVIATPRKFNINRILRLKVQVRATEPLHRIGMNFGVRFAFDKGQATGPFVCGRKNHSDEYSPEFCGNANGADGGFDKSQYIHLNHYKDTFEWSEYGYFVGCNKLGEYPYPMDPVYYPNARWYSFPGLCPSKLYYEKDGSCQVSAPGGYCPGVEPNGNGTCTWNYEHAGEISLDELTGIKRSEAVNLAVKEYDPITDEGSHFHWWDGINSTAKNEKRIQQAEALFAKKFPEMSNLTEPACDFAFGPFYKLFYRKDGWSSSEPCGKPSAECLSSMKWIRSDGIKSHPSWYVPLTSESSDEDIQRFQYTVGKGGCVRPCSKGDAGNSMDAASKGGITSSNNTDAA
eukprot:TRINITY_DN13096_c0_g1_i1.p1 TRINITY_DN13096_c0_g1~~TRINITY_DN13096_c0_g1_i1.p1  ORF type:complete len:479 (-),score=79.13 TRINITY_DN13096_c0_g1_i1:49-1485(-)